MPQQSWPLTEPTEVELTAGDVMTRDPVTVDADKGDVLMVAHMDAQALALTIETGEAHYFSRSRGRLWKKGEESGHIQRVVELSLGRLVRDEQRGIYGMDR